MQHKILLLDELGEKWGYSHTFFNLRTPADAIRLLCINYPDFQKHLLTSKKKGIDYKITQVDQDLDLSDLFLPLGKHDLVITPVISGSKNAIKIVTGVALVVATGGFGAGFGGTALLGNATLGSIGAKIGAGLILSGVTDIISPQPQLGNLSFGAFDAPVSGFTGGAGGITRGSDGSQSYAYTGAANTVGLGKTIPVVYGKALVGGHILSTDIEIASDSDPLMKFIREPSLSTVQLNGEDVKGKYSSVGGLTARILNDSTNSVRGTARFLSSHKSINLQKETDQLVTAITATFDGVENSRRFQIFLQVRGLVDFVGDQNSTRIDGFITYAIKVFETDNNTLVLNNQATIQGLTRASQKFNYICKLPWVFIEGKNNYKVFVQIIDTSVDFNEAAFVVRQVGYNLRKN